MRNFPGSIIVPYAGQFGGLSITAHKKSQQQPRAVTLTIPWAQYAPKMGATGTVFNGAVTFDLSTGTTAAALDIVKSVYIDNAAVDRPVTIQCADTGHQITCPDGSAGWYPLITNGTAFTLFTDNVIPLKNGNQSTRLIFSNASFDTFGAPELNRAQQLFRASGTANFTTPVLSDRLAVVPYTFTNPAATNNYPVTPALVNSQIVITDVIIDMDPLNSGTQSTNTYALSSSSGQIFQFAKKVIVSTNQVVSEKILELHNLQLVVPGDTALNFAVTNINGAFAQYGGKLTLQYAQIQLPAVSN